MTYKGALVLMGSGELTPTMVEVHKELLSRLGESSRAVFIDTPAGFQLNVDEISRRAAEYFSTRVRHPLAVASYKSKDGTSLYEAEQAFHLIRDGDYILIGPGSPTYAVRQFRDTPVPDILVRRIEAGGCLVAASAAALTVGRYTLPVYEIYKVGEALHWMDGMDILGRLGFNLVVVPHWNNAEGGTHDTRFCFMGESRFRQLEALLPPDVGVLGLDEHTACIIDFSTGRAEVKGIGQVVLRQQDSVTIFEKGERFPIELLRGESAQSRWTPRRKSPAAEASRKEVESDGEDSFWNRIHRLEADFRQGLSAYDSKRITTALLELDRVIWQAQGDLESEADITQAREVLRDLLVLLGTVLAATPKDASQCLTPLVEELLDLRENFRRERQWRAADAIRDSLYKADIVVEDTQQGVRWHKRHG